MGVARIQRGQAAMSARRLDGDSAKVSMDRRRRHYKRRVPTEPLPVTRLRCRGSALPILITSQAKRNLSSRSGIGGVLNAT